MNHGMCHPLLGEHNRCQQQLTTDGPANMTTCTTTMMYTHKPQLSGPWQHLLTNWHRTACKLVEQALDNCSMYKGSTQYTVHSTVDTTHMHTSTHSHMRVNSSYRSTPPHPNGQLQQTQMLCCWGATSKEDHNCCCPPALENVLSMQVGDWLADDHCVPATATSTDAFSQCPLQRDVAHRLLTHTQSVCKHRAHSMPCARHPTPYPS